MKLDQATLVGIGVLILASCTNASTPDGDISSAQAEVLVRLESLAASAQESDPAEYFSHFDKEHFTALNADGTVTHDFEGFRLAFQSGAENIASYHSLEFDNVKISVIPPSTAVLVNEYSAKIELVSGDVVTVDGAGTQVWHKSNNGWVLRHVSSSIKP